MSRLSVIQLHYNKLPKHTGIVFSLVSVLVEFLLPFYVAGWTYRPNFTLMVHTTSKMELDELGVNFPTLQMRRVKL